MDQFQSISSGKGILKDYTGGQTTPNSLSEALKRRRHKLTMTKLGVDPRDRETSMLKPPGER